MWNAFKINGGNRISLFTDIRWTLVDKDGGIEPKIVVEQSACWTLLVPMSFAPENYVCIKLVNR